MYGGTNFRTAFLMPHYRIFADILFARGAEKLIEYKNTFKTSVKLQNVSDSPIRWTSKI